MPPMWTMRFPSIHAIDQVPRPAFRSIPDQFPPFFPADSLSVKKVAAADMPGNLVGPAR